MWIGMSMTKLIERFLQPPPSIPFSVCSPARFSLGTGVVKNTVAKTGPQYLHKSNRRGGHSVTAREKELPIVI